MKKLRISRLTLENFKGVDRLEINLHGANAVISGQNGAGKTTVADAYTWALTGKMTDGRTAEIGYYDSTGNLDAEATHFVEVEFTDGTTFRRESNGTSRFYANGIPVKSKEYGDEISNATGGALGMLIMPQNFCKMHWQDRRQILMSLVNITNAEVVASTPELQELAPLIEKHEPELIRRKATADRKKLNAELSTIPARIDELHRTVRPADLPSAADVGAKIAELERQVLAKGIQIRELQKATTKALEPINAINRLTQLAMETERDVAKTAEQIERNGTRLENLRTDWKKASEAMSGKCPTCGAKVVRRRLPEFQQKLDRIGQDGRQLAEMQKKLKATLEEATLKADKIRSQIANMKAQQEKAEEDPVHDQLEQALQERDEIQRRLSRLQSELTAIEASEKTSARITELRQHEIQIGGQIAELDKQLYLVDTFTAQQIKLTEAAINSKFEVVTWKMFEPFKSGEGARDCCEPLVNGVPYSGNLSKGEKLKAAMDILRTLQTAYGVELPVFIDDAESYTSNSKIDLPNQIIRLKAAEGVKTLKIDVEQSAEKPMQISLFEEATA